MRITQTTPRRSSRKNDSGSGLINSTFLDIVGNLFKLSLLVTIGLYAYLLWGLFSGQMADVSQPRSPADLERVVQLIRTLSMWLNLSLVLCLATCCLLYYEEETLGLILVLVAAFLAYGLQFCIDILFAADSARLTSGAASVETLQTIHQTALIIGVPGVLLLLRAIGMKIVQGRRGQDLTKMAYGAHVHRQDRAQPLIGAMAKCWELPFCREAIRVRCPIFHAKTKCWKERVGCMCEENIILLAMGDDRPVAANLTQEQGFVPIGDLLTKPTAAAVAEQTTTRIHTRLGPKGVRIPTNPHMTDSQKRERCRNCVIYNEHQRQKYQALSPIVTLAVPLFVALNFEMLRHGLVSAMRMLDQFFARVSFSGSGRETSLQLAREVSSSLSVEVIIIICLTLVAMTWALRSLEYCVFKLKI